MNRGYKYGKGSEKVIATLTPVLQKVCRGGLYIANTRKLYCPDVSIVRGLTSAADQFKLYKKGREKIRLPDLNGTKWIVTGKTVTNCDGYDKISDHQKFDFDGLGYAFDFAAWINGGSNYEDPNMALIATCFFEYASDENIMIDWGGNYRSISDGSHISLIV